MKRTQQHYLVLGQKDVDFKTCAQCGMTYTPQKKQDKHLHHIFHKKTLLQKISSTRKSTKPLFGFPKTLQGKLSRCAPQKSSLLKFLVKKYFLTTLKGDVKNDHLWSLMYAGQTISLIWVTPSIQAAKPWNSSSLHTSFSPCHAALMHLVNKDKGSFQLEREPPFNTTVPAGFQVKFIWVHENFRRQKIATQILTTIRKEPCQYVLAFHTPTTVESAFFFAFTHSLHTHSKPMTPTLHHNSSNAQFSFYCVVS